MLRALRSQLMLDGALGSVEVGATVEEVDVITAAALGGEYKDVWDRISGQVLDGRKVHNARLEEMTYMRNLEVFEYATEQQAREATGRAPVSVVGVFRYGDDFVALGRRAAVAEFSRALGTKLIVKVRGTLGP